jgi:hypothetical protein
MVSDFDNNKADAVLPAAISKEGSAFDVESIAMENIRVKRKASILQLGNYQTV